ncbi:MAG: hypothetical protein GY806_07360 [Gammaproteobacteria bacterium]|nr:hypothetical protein [Gammaproteobacteria bacterium]
MEVSKIVPQFFYDVIARGVPGGAFLIGVSFALGEDISVKRIVMAGLDISSAPTTEAILLLVLFAFYAYVIGHVIGPASDWVSKLKLLDLAFSNKFHVLRNCMNPEESRLPRNIQEFLKNEIGENDETDKFQYTSVLFIWADWLRLRSADAGARIVKLRAEYRMLIGLSVVGMLIIIIHVIWVIFVEISLNVKLIVISFLVFSLGLLGYCKAYSTFQWGVINNFYAQKIIDESKYESEAEAVTKNIDR